MGELERLSCDASVEEIVALVRREGAFILTGALSTSFVDETLAELQPYIDATSAPDDPLAGTRTTRTGALVARSSHAREIIMNGKIMAAAKDFLKPYCARIQLHLGQVIRLKPGQEAQPLHRDRWSWGTYLQHVEPQFSTIWALTEFTRGNGATVVVPGSTDWPDERRPQEHELRFAEMDKGSALVYSGSVFHGGGANHSRADRVGMNVGYTLSWLRQEENQYLSCPPEIARTLPHEMQALIGYTQGSYGLGYYSPPLEPGKGPECVGPEFALGRPIEGFGLGGESLREELIESVRPEEPR